MYPTLFHIFGFRVDSYSVLWFTALSAAIVWAVKRLEIYELDEDEARNIMSVSFFFMLFGAHAYEYFDHWKIYLNKPSLFLDCNRGGLHEFGAISGALISAFVICMVRRKISFLKLCEAASIPAVLTIAIGRWGCFLNGCCVGIPSKFFTAVHFPADKAGVTRHPVQIYYSLFAFVIVFILMKIEKKISKSHSLSDSHSILAPLALILYSIMRLSISPLRTRRTFSYLFSRAFPYKYLIILIPFEIIWLMYGLRRLRSAKTL